MTATTVRVSGRQLGRILGFAPSYISKLKKLGILNACYNNKKKICVEVAVQEIEQSRDPAKEYVRARWEQYRASENTPRDDKGDQATGMGITDSGKESGVAPAGSDVIAAEPGVASDQLPFVTADTSAESIQDTNVLSFQDAKTHKERYAAKQAELDYKRAAGELVLVKDIRSAAFNSGRILRDSLLSIPDRQSQVLAAETDPVRIHEILTKELSQALNEFTTQQLTAGSAKR